MKRLILASFLIFSMGLNADLKEKMSGCSIIDSNEFRLKCYDRVYKEETTINTAPKESGYIGKWGQSIDTDPMTDKTIVVLSLNSENRISNSFSYVQPTLLIRCKNNRTEVFINWDVYLGLDSTSVTTRVDKNSKVTRSWGISTDTKATFAPYGYSFAKKLIGHKKLVAEVTPYGANPTTVTFNIDGIDNAIKPLRKECGW